MKKENSDFKKAPVERLAEAFLSLNSIEECYAFFGDLFTSREIEDISSRLEVATLLKEGENYIDIAAKTGASTATISRVSKCLSGALGGYRMVLSRSEGEENKERGDISFDALSPDEVSAVRAIIACLRNKK